MENRYLFRAKRIDNGEWVEGFPFLVNDVSYILPHHNTGQPIHIDNLLSTSVEVLEDTICQCTGLKNKNGKLIWENDIVKDLFSDTAAPIRYGSYQSCFDSTKVEHVGFYVDWSGKYNKNYRKDLGYWIHMVDAEIIGNAIDNPELLEE